MSRAIGIDDGLYVTYTGGGWWGTWVPWGAGLPEGKAKLVTSYDNQHVFALGIEHLPNGVHHFQHRAIKICHRGVGRQLVVPPWIQGAASPTRPAALIRDPSG